MSGPKNKNNAGFPPQPPSRSAKKRESSALQKLGEELIALSPAERESIDPGEDLLEALAMHDRISDREGGRRQRQFIGKLMRVADAERIASALAARKNQKAVELKKYQDAYDWRGKLAAASGEELDELINDLGKKADPDLWLVSRGMILDLAQKARENTPSGKGAFRKLFRELIRLF